MRLRNLQPSWQHCKVRRLNKPSYKKAEVAIEQWPAKKPTAGGISDGKELKMKTISFKQTESALFNLDSMRTKLLNEQYEQPEREDELQVRIDEVETLLEKMHFGRVTRSEWNRIQEIVNERQMQRYVTCLNSGMDERDAAGAFDD